MHWGVIAQWAAIVVSVALAIRAERDAATARRESAEALARVATATEELAAAQRRPEIAWRVDHGTGVLYQLVNVGTITATNVQIVGPDAAKQRLRFRPAARLSPQQPHEFDLFGYVSHLLVTCDEQPEPQVAHVPPPHPGAPSG